MMNDHEEMKVVGDKRKIRKSRVKGKARKYWLLFCHTYCFKKRFICQSSNHQQEFLSVYFYHFGPTLVNHIEQKMKQTRMRTSKMEKTDVHSEYSNVRWKILWFWRLQMKIHKEQNPKTDLDNNLDYIRVETVRPKFTHQINRCTTKRGIQIQQSHVWLASYTSKFSKL